MNFRLQDQLMGFIFFFVISLGPLIQKLNFIRVAHLKFHHSKDLSIDTNHHSIHKFEEELLVLKVLFFHLKLHEPIQSQNLGLVAEMDCCLFYRINLIYLSYFLHLFLTIVIYVNILHQVLTMLINILHFKNISIIPKTDHFKQNVIQNHLSNYKLM